MKRIIELGNNVKVEAGNDGFKIISANGSLINLDSEGEILSYENVVTANNEKKRKKYLSRFVRIGEDERELILNYITLHSDSSLDEQQKKFFFDLKQALDKVKYEFYATVVFNCCEKIELYSEYKNELPKYILEKSNQNETIIWTAYNIVRKYWTYKEAFDNNKFLVIEGLYVLKKEE